MQKNHILLTQILKLLLFTLILFSAPTYAAQLCVTVPPADTSTVSYDDDIKVQSFDGVEIAANIFLPKSNPPSQGFPAIIFVNSWAIEEHQYVVQAVKFASKGYAVFSYSARGWGCSTGVVDTIGDNDIKDTSAVIDYLVNNYPVDASNIGISGISYGGGISLRGAANDARIKTAVVMSTPTDLVEALYGQDTLRLVWGGILTLSGQLLSNLDPIVPEHYFNIMFNRNVSNALSWAARRSPISDVDKINARGTPIYIANSLGDNLFQPNAIIDFFEKLTVPKRLDLNQGTHATFELPGLIGLQNYAWINAHDWFDFWLKGVNTGIMNKAPVTMLSENTHQRSEYQSWPIPQAQTKKLHLKPQSIFSMGELSSSRYNKWYGRSNRFYSGIDSGASTGIPAISELVSGYTKLPIYHYLPFTNKNHAIVHKSSALRNGLSIRGVSKLSLNITPTNKDMSLIAYLYDVDKNNVAKLITHAPISIRNARRHRSTQVNLDFIAAAYDIPRGNSLALVVDTQDLLYSPATLFPFSVKVNYSRSKDSFLTVPFVE